MSNILNTALSALNTNQRALAAISNNIANVNTEGFSRQNVDLASRVPNQFGFGSIGTGVEITGVRRSYDAFVAGQLRQSESGFAEQNTLTQLGSQLELVVADEGNGLATSVSRFFDSLQEVSANPSSLSARQVLLSEANSMASRFFEVDTRFAGATAEANERLGISVRDANALVDRLAQINTEITQNSSARVGQQPNDLLDQRDQLLVELSRLVKVTTSASSDGAVNVFVGNGQPLIVGGQSNKLSLAPGATPDQPRILLGGVSDVTSVLSGGSLGGLLKFRDSTLQTARADLKALATTVTTAFNDLQAAGLDLSGTVGQPLFGSSADPSLPQGPNGRILEVLIRDPSAIAASVSGASGDNRNINAMAALENQVFTINGRNTTLADGVRGLVGAIATDVRDARLGADAQKALLEQATLRRESVSGVNLDEEAAELLKFQQAYQAAAQMATVANTLFDSLIAAFR